MAGIDRARLLAAERLLMAIAMVALGWYVGVRIGAALDQRADAQAFERYVETAARGAPAADANLAAAPLPAGTPVRPARTSASSPRGVVGKIEIARLGLEAVVREGTDARTLRRAVGHVAHTPLPGAGGNAALAGHRDTFFRPLEHVRRGDQVRVTTTTGTYTYVVRDTRVVDPTDVSVLDPTPADVLTLITCYPFTYVGSAPKRFVVRAARMDSTF